MSPPTHNLNCSQIPRKYPSDILENVRGDQAVVKLQIGSRKGKKIHPKRLESQFIKT